jgi:serine/threonine protein kinase
LGDGATEHRLRGAIEPDDELLFPELKCKICDFGLATVTEQVTKGTTGTFRWMAPEVMRGEECTAASDVYAFGMVLCVPPSAHHTQRPPEHDRCA